MCKGDRGDDPRGPRSDQIMTDQSEATLLSVFVFDFFRHCSTGVAAANHTTPHHQHAHHDKNCTTPLLVLEHRSGLVSVSCHREFVTSLILPSALSICTTTQLDNLSFCSAPVTQSNMTSTWYAYHHHRYSSMKIVPSHCPHAIRRLPLTKHSFPIMRPLLLPHPDAPGPTSGFVSSTSSSPSTHHSTAASLHPPLCNGPALPIGMDS